MSDETKTGAVDSASSFPLAPTYEAPRTTFALEPGHVGKPSVALTLAEQREVAAVRVDDKLRREARAIVEAMTGAAEIDDDLYALLPDGTRVLVHEAEIPATWSKRQKRIAKDARRSNKDAPVYLKAMQDIDRAYIAADATRGEGDKPLNVSATNVQINVFQYGTRDYPVKEITDDE